MSKITGQTAAKSVSNMRPLRTYFSGSHSEAIDLTLLNQFLKNLTHTMPTAGRYRSSPRACTASFDRTIASLLPHKSPEIC
jgi:hypothetical protein